MRDEELEARVITKGMLTRAALHAYRAWVRLDKGHVKQGREAEEMRECAKLLRLALELVALDWHEATQPGFGADPNRCPSAPASEQEPEDFVKIE